MFSYFVFIIISAFPWLMFSFLSFFSASVSAVFLFVVNLSSTTLQIGLLVFCPHDPTTLYSLKIFHGQVFSYCNVSHSVKSLLLLVWVSWVMFLWLAVGSSWFWRFDSCLCYARSNRSHVGFEGFRFARISVVAEYFDVMITLATLLLTNL